MKTMRSPLFCSLVLSTCVACASSPQARRQAGILPSREPASASVAAPAPAVAVAQPDVVPASDNELEREIRDADAGMKLGEAENNTVPDAPITSPSARIPIEFNEDVQRWIQYFTVKDRERFERFLGRGSQYKDLVQAILRREGIPPELYYLAMIESGFATHAKSRVAAVGFWQFMRGTSKMYSLDTNAYVDERRDIVRSTEAAAKFLKGLHDVFQSWYLAMASYNSGPGRVLGAIMRSNTRDFWKLVELKRLPPETRNYVPKFLAAVIIGKNPARYGFKGFEQERFPEISAVSIPGGVRLTDVSREAGVPYSELVEVNPHLMRAMTPPNVSSYDIWVPARRAASVAQVSERLAAFKVRVREPARKIASSRGSSRRGSGSKVAVGYRRNGAPSTRVILHRVRRGEGLISIARQYGVDVSDLKRANALRGNAIQVGQRLRVKVARK